jgi:serine-type D-Ala-D-Ala endopeptidase (penicillin-binding protein 7)
MNWGRSLGLLAVAGLLFASAFSHGAASSTSKGKAIARTASVKSSTLRAHMDGPDLKSSSVLILDQTHSSVLYSRRADVALPIASITKLMTALVVADAQLPLDEVITITKDDRNGGRGSYSRLPAGLKLTRGDLLHLSLMSSENCAARALGRAYPGGRSAFVKAMNRKARELGMTSARFVDPAGLSGQNVASPVDLVKLVVAASESPTIREYSVNKGHSVRVGRKILAFHNTNPLVLNPAWNISLQKTGYLAEAGRCLVMQTEIQGRQVVMVLMNSQGKYTRVADAKRARAWMEARLDKSLNEPNGDTEIVRGAGS